MQPGMPVPYHYLLDLLDMLPKSSGTHAHKCTNCGNVWHHDDSCAGDPLEHTCQRCGTQSWFRHYGD